MRNHLDKRVLRRAWTTRPSDRESAFPDRIELVSHLTDCKCLQMRGEQLGPLRGKHVLGQTPAARADQGVRPFNSSRTFSHSTFHSIAIAWSFAVSVGARRSSSTRGIAASERI